MILEMREITEANQEETKFISWVYHGKVELVLDIIFFSPSRHNYVYRGIYQCLELICKLYLNDGLSTYFIFK